MIWLSGLCMAVVLQADAGACSPQGRLSGRLSGRDSQKEAGTYQWEAGLKNVSALVVSAL